MNTMNLIDEKTSTEEIRNRITNLRSMMIEVGSIYGLDHNKTIAISQKLDVYIMEIQKRNSYDFA
ncbi:aspartyl-phosphate phosphatase Spo0E family protein [Pontibacillus salicampi]|uniref:Aspartyl-phosphate phosphatase Spo0E family protein n=1 Tax=Pontibacillus salicampi TaxID=1449801 RepID=A0ABV6LQT6_9BACI